MLIRYPTELLWTTTDGYRYLEALDLQQAMDRVPPNVTADEIQVRDGNGEWRFVAGRGES